MGWLLLVLICCAMAGPFYVVMRHYRVPPETRGIALGGSTIIFIALFAWGAVALWLGPASGGY